jgi:hypothetical protein
MSDERVEIGPLFTDGNRRGSTDHAEDFGLVRSVLALASKDYDPSKMEERADAFSCLRAHAKEWISSLLARVDELESRVRLDHADPCPWEAAIKKRHNGYDPEMRKPPVSLKEPASPEQALSELLDGAENEYVKGFQAGREAERHVQPEHTDSDMSLVATIRGLVDRWLMDPTPRAAAATLETDTIYALAAVLRDYIERSDYVRCVSSATAKSEEPK